MLKSILKTPLFWLGVAVLVVGTGPLVVAGLTMSSNPVGPGMLASCTFWPAVITIIGGIVQGILNWRNEPGQSHPRSRPPLKEP